MSVSNSWTMRNLVGPRGLSDQKTGRTKMRDRAIMVQACRNAKLMLSSYKILVQLMCYGPLQLQRQSLSLSLSLSLYFSLI